MSNLEHRIEQALTALSEPYHAGTRVANCVVHISLPITERPPSCTLCLSDLQNHMNFAIRVNEFLHAKIDKAILSLEGK